MSVPPQKQTDTQENPFSRRQQISGSTSIPSSTPSVQQGQPTPLDITRLVLLGWFCIGLNPGMGPGGAGGLAAVSCWHFYYKHGIGNKGGMKWKIQPSKSLGKVQLIEGTRDATEGLSNSAIQLGLLVLKRWDDSNPKMSQPEQVAMIEARCRRIHKAIKEGGEGATNGATKGLMKAYITRSLQALAEDGLIMLPPKEKDGTQVANVDLVIEELEILEARAREQANTIKLAWNSW